MTSRDLIDHQPSPQSPDGQPYATTGVGTPRRKRGAPSGNQNARKHGFYSIALSPQEQETLQEAVNIKGLGSEIALMRVKITRLLAYADTSPELLLKAVRALTRMVAVHDQVTYH